MKVIGERIAIVPDPLPEKSEGGIWIDCDKSRGTGQNTLTIGTVKGVGERCKYGVRVGDRVAFREFMGFVEDGVNYVYEKDVLTVIE